MFIFIYTFFSSYSVIVEIRMWQNKRPLCPPVTQNVIIDFVIIYNEFYYSSHQLVLHHEILAFLILVPTNITLVDAVCVIVCVWQLEKLKKQSCQREGELKVTSALKVKSRPGERSKDSLRLLKDMRTLQTSLRSDEHRWDYWRVHTHFTRNREHELPCRYTQGLCPEIWVSLSGAILILLLKKKKNLTQFCKIFFLTQKKGWNTHAASEEKIINGKTKAFIYFFKKYIHYSQLMARMIWIHSSLFRSSEKTWTSCCLRVVWGLTEYFMP